MKTLIVERDERGVVSVQLNRLEKKNAIDYRMFQDLLEVFDEMSRSDTDRVLVLSGAAGTSAREPTSAAAATLPTASSSPTCASTGRWRSRSTSCRSRRSRRSAASRSAPGSTSRSAAI